MAEHHLPEMACIIKTFADDFAVLSERLKAGHDIVRQWDELSASGHFILTNEQVDAFTDAMADPEWPTVLD